MLRAMGVEDEKADEIIEAHAETVDALKRQIADAGEGGEGDLGYSWDHRWDFWPGGEVDCSSLVISVLRECGFETGTASYTGDMREQLCAHGWRVVAPDGDPHVGDILLNDARHVAVCVAPGTVSQASIDESGGVRGGRPGDQTGWETNTRGYYDYPWDCYLRYGDAGGGPAPACRLLTGGPGLPCVSVSRGSAPFAPSRTMVKKDRPRQFMP